MTTSENTPHDNCVPSDSIIAQTWNPAESVVDHSYRSINVLSLLAFLMGLFSFTFLASFWFYFVPLSAIILSVLALIQIQRSEGRFFGKRLAMCALFLSLLSIPAYFAMWGTYNQILSQQAIQVAPLVFEELKNNDIPGYLDLKNSKWGRPKTKVPLEDRWKKLAENEFSTEAVDGLIRSDLIRTMITLGDKANVTFFKAKPIEHASSIYAPFIYAVTYPVDSGKETFFVKVVMQRTVNEETAQGKKQDSASWQLSRFEGPVLPKEFGGKE